MDKVILRVILTETRPSTWLREVVVEGDTQEQCHERVTSILKNRMNLITWNAIESDN